MKNYRLRKYEPKDTPGIQKVFRANLIEEWTRHHDSKYLPNAMKYVEETCSGGDLCNIEDVYFRPGGYFWVLVDEDDQVRGTVGLEKLSGSTGELRRMCLIQSLRRQGWGTKLFEVLKEKASYMNLQTITCSTPEHGDDVLQFYKKFGFFDTGKRSPIHKSTIEEVFLEYRMPAN